MHDICRGSIKYVSRTLHMGSKPSWWVQQLFRQGWSGIGPILYFLHGVNLAWHEYYAALQPEA